MDHSEILFQLERCSASIEVKNIRPLPLDRWLSLSVLHKAIRRGDRKTAQRATVTLWQQDKRSFWNRIGVVACEDIGSASHEVITSVLIAVNNATWRKQVGDLRVALHLTNLLCSAIKIRLADEIYSVADHAPEYKALRQSMGMASDHVLADTALNVQKLLPERCLALWYLIGTRRYPSDNLITRSGSLDMAVDVLRSIGAPNDLTEACIGALKRSPYPLALWTPLLWTEIKKHPRSLVSWNNHYQPSAMVNGIPLIALDQFTRIGKTCYRKLQASVPALKAYTTRQIGLAIFYIEACHVDNRLACLQLDEYRHAGEIADIQDAGLTVPQYNELTELLVINADRLEKIRRQELKAYLQTSHEQFQLVAGHE